MPLEVTPSSEAEKKMECAWVAGWLSGCIGAESLGHLLPPALAEAYRVGRDQGIANRAEASMDAWAYAAFHAKDSSVTDGTSETDSRSWAEMVVVSVTDALVAAGVEPPQTHGEGLSPEQYAEIIRTLTD